MKKKLEQKKCSAKHWSVCKKFAKPLVNVCVSVKEKEREKVCVCEVFFTLFSTTNNII